MPQVIQVTANHTVRRERPPQWVPSSPPTIHSATAISWMEHGAQRARRSSARTTDASHFNLGMESICHEFRHCVGKSSLYIWHVNKHGSHEVYSDHRPQRYIYYMFNPLQCFKVLLYRDCKTIANPLFGHKITKKCRKNDDLFKISANNLIFLCNFAANITQMSNKVIQNG